MSKSIVFSLLISLSFSPNILALKLNSLLEEISVRTQKRVLFTETKTAFFLNEPLISKGSLAFIYPSTLYKKITSPTHSEQRVVENEVSILSPNEPLRSTALSNHPKLAITINAIRWILSGQAKMLNTHFDIELKGNLQAWSILLKPKDYVLQQSIESISIFGLSNNIDSFLIKRGNGDLITTELHAEH